MFFRRQDQAAQRVAARRQREDEAPRLKALIPSLKNLKLELEEQREQRSIPEARHVRHVVVDTAPALFCLKCCDSACKEGGHDITQAVLAALEASLTHFEGKDECRGSVGTSPCMRVLRFVGTAVYS